MNNTIPKDLDEAVSNLSFLAEEDVSYIATSEIAPVHLHFGLGMTLRNLWGLWTKDSPLVKWFNNIGIFHADDMSSIILKARFCRVRNTPFDLDVEVKHYQKYWEERGTGVG